MLFGIPPAALPAPPGLPRWTERLTGCGRIAGPGDHVLFYTIAYA